MNCMGRGERPSSRSHGLFVLDTGTFLLLFSNLLFFTLYSSYIPVEAPALDTGTFNTSNASSWRAPVFSANEHAGAGPLPPSNERGLSVYANEGAGAELAQGQEMAATTEPLPARRLHAVPVAPAAPAPMPAVSPQPSHPASHSQGAALHPDRDPGNPALHSRFVELSEAYRVLSREESRRNYDHQLHSASSPRSSGTTAQPKYTQQTHSSWEPPNAQYWAQFHNVRPQGPESRQQQHKHNLRVLGYCLLLMVAGMGLHYVAFRKLEQVHRSFMDEKDRIITAIYNDTRARARCVTALPCMAPCSTPPPWILLPTYLAPCSAPSPWIPLPSIFSSGLTEPEFSRSAS
ncbi:dnaJ homolog subfamily C member 4 isoform X1 [Meriones unguiculatus]|uniref:dnaJ homolog subfamily C member 4 isoform X1 n=1 Tax=Meriones unguiculatus TaxID=10047 RepID=UPI00293ECC85|nr:dnaJ homolog subfamily C member 4 isoform X1 [Meriones unguiculatus]